MFVAHLPCARREAYIALCNPPESSYFFLLSDKATGSET